MSLKPFCTPCMQFQKHNRGKISGMAQPVNSIMVARKDVNDCVKSGFSKRNHGKPCDGCARRKVRCDLNVPCAQCSKHNLNCTNIRQIGKCGPKSLHLKTIRSINSMSKNNKNFLITREDVAKLKLTIHVTALTETLDIFQKWFYSIWPITDATELLASIDTDGLHNDISITEQNAMVWSLILSLCAAIISQLSFVTEKPIGINIPRVFSAKDLADGALEIRKEFNFGPRPSIAVLLTSFFLYEYFVHVKGQKHSSILYLRESITMAQLLRLHDPSSYVNRPKEEVHRLSKIYYVLLITERYTSIEDNIPILLEPDIPLPKLEYEKYPEMAADFSELAKIFSIPDRRIFENLVSHYKPEKTPKDAKKFFHLAESLSSNYIVKIQTSLSNISIFALAPDQQVLNILISKFWVQALVWSVTLENNLLDTEEQCLSPTFPLHLGEKFLNSTKELGAVAFECNGFGVAFKLLEIINISLLALELIPLNSRHIYFCVIKDLFQLVRIFETSVNIPDELLTKATSIFTTFDKHDITQRPESDLIQFSLPCCSRQAEIDFDEPFFYDTVPSGSIPSDKISQDLEISDQKNNDYQLELVSNTIYTAFIHD